MYFQDTEYMINGSPMFIIDQVNKNSTNYIAAFTAHKFINEKLVDTHIVEVEN